MRINYNLSAMLTNSQLLRNERNQQSAAERLASGLKINHAKDDPAGMAISNKMDVQIEGIRQASRNSSDGISILETADSSLNEVTNIIQRMRELAVQAASDTNALEDREAIQVEIDSLSEEIDRVSTNTEFNKKVLLDGSLSRRTYTNNRKVEITNVGTGVPTNKYGVTITADARQAVFRGAFSDTFGITVGGITLSHATREKEVEECFEDYNGDKRLKQEAAGKVTINGHIIEFEGGESYDEIYRKLRDGAEIVDVTCVATLESDVVSVINHSLPTGKYAGCQFAPDGSGKYEDTAGYMPCSDGWGGTNPLVFISKEYGSSEKLNISCDNAMLATALGLAKQRGIDNKLAHSADADAVKNASSEIRCYRSTDSFLEEMPDPPVVLDRNNPAHKKYFDDPSLTAGMAMPALYKGSIIDLADPANKKYTTFFDKVDAIPAELAGKIKISVNDYNDFDSEGNPRTYDKTIEIAEGDSAEAVYEKIKGACNDVGAELLLTNDVRKDNYDVFEGVYNYSQALVFRTEDVNSSIEVKCDNISLATMLGLPVCEWSVEGKDCRADFTDGDDTKVGTQRIGFADSATITTKGNKITVTDKNGFELELEAEKKTCATFYSDWSASGRIGRDVTMPSGDEVGEISGLASTDGNYYDMGTWGERIDIIADVTGYGMMTVHTGANENQIIDMDIPRIDCKSLDIDGLNVRSGWTADKALAKLDAALIKVNAARSRIGAYQNRLESTVASLDANDEDLTAAVSRIRDVDMAAETTEYTQHTILVQAATSVLAQANELPQQALQLIQ